mmetsp:Transcript_4030/g.5851  ORF Transcript_4030/g.5851 Transcript_4030/m.5851 type:complete len:80 (+) Transcript_4030:145-384(+)
MQLQLQHSPKHRTTPASYHATYHSNNHGTPSKSITANEAQSQSSPPQFDSFYPTTGSTFCSAGIPWHPSPSSSGFGSWA